MNYHDQLKKRGIKPELTPFRHNSWKKMINGKMYYFPYPQTKTGYDQAIADLIQLKNKLNNDRDYIEKYNHHIELFKSVIKYYDAFGTIKSELNLRKQIEQLIAKLEECKTQTVLPEILPLGEFYSKKEFFNEFCRLCANLGSTEYVLPDKWIDRLSRLEHTKTEKQPQTIKHWIDSYLERVNSRVDRTIVKKTAESRKYKLSNLIAYVDGQNHISTIDDDFVLKYHEHVDDCELSQESKIGYFATFKMWVRWCSTNTSCDLSTPKSLNSREFTFREPQGIGRTRQQKKLLLWNKDDFDKALGIPEPYRTYCLLMLNCGFRHVDIANLQHGDIVGNRIIIQRNKLNQLATAPVINYLLWDETIKGIKKNKIEGKLVFGDVENKIKMWWKRYKTKYLLTNKRLDYLRKTGATFINDDNLSEMYLGECLSTTTKKNYKFNDGDVMPELDKAIMRLGHHFGLSKEPTQSIELTPEIKAILQQNGVNF